MKNIGTILILLIKCIYIITLDNIQNKFIINHYIPTFDSSREELFFPYNFTFRDFIDEGRYVFDTASFYIWKNSPSEDEDPENSISLKTRYNENISGFSKKTSDNINWISLNLDKYPKDFGSICIPINIPENFKVDKDRIYNYLDLIKDEYSQKYINYVQESLTSGYISFGEIDKVFNEKKNDKDIKTCKCVQPPDNDSQNYFLNFWNCKISSFSIDNIKVSSLYSKSINGDIFAIFALSEEYIIAPKRTGGEIIEQYRELIGKKKCKMEKFKSNSNIKIMACKKFNFAELPDFTITLEGEISLLALSFDLFKNKNDTHVYFKILLNEEDTKEYWYLGDPIIKNYNLLFDFNKAGEEKITIVSSDKYNSFSIFLSFIGASVIALIYFGTLLFARIKINILSKRKKKNQNEKVRKTAKKIKKIIRKQNDFEIPEGNIPIQNMIKNRNVLDENNEESKFNFDVYSELKETSEKNLISEHSNESKSSSNLNFKNNNNSISNSFGSENDLENKINQLKRKKNKQDNNNVEYELDYINNNNTINSGDEGECEMLGEGEEEGSLPPFNTRK